MFTPKRLASFVCLALIAAFSSTSANAADETITLNTVVKPNGGKLYKEVRVPASMTLTVDVHTPATSPRVNPLKRAVMKFPTDLTYNPNNKLTPVCSERALNVQSNLSAGVAGTVDLCPKSVIGTGTAKIYLAKVHSPNALIEDPELVIFNAGRDSNGNAKMKIYAYSRATQVGILMYGSLTPKGIQDVAIPVLAEDSGTSNFVLSIPGPGLTVQDPGSPTGTRTVRGLDPKYTRAKCSTGTWTTGGTFTLGERTYPGGVDTTPETTVEATPYSMSCKGLAGKARLARATAKGPKRLRRGTRKVFRVTVRNPGTATAKKVKVRVSGSGRGKGHIGNLGPGKAKTVRVRVRITGRKGRPARIVFRIVGKGVSTRTVARARILR